MAYDEKLADRIRESLADVDNALINSRTGHSFEMDKRFVVIFSTQNEMSSNISLPPRGTITHPCAYSSRGPFAVTQSPWLQIGIKVMLFSVKVVDIILIIPRGAVFY